MKTEWICVHCDLPPVIVTKLLICVSQLWCGWQSVQCQVASSRRWCSSVCVCVVMITWSRLYAVVTWHDVHCDKCCVGCYGVSEMESVDSGSSSASTEPWFCDACRAGVKPVSCSSLLSTVCLLRLHLLILILQIYWFAHRPILRTNVTSLMEL